MWLTVPLKTPFEHVSGHFQISQQNENAAPRTPSIWASMVLIYFNEVNKLMSLQRKVQGQSAGPQAQRISP
jgi:hypothetical protein